MVRIWSELPGARLKEQMADAATTLWLLFWGSLAWQLFSLLAGFAEAGRMVRGGGQTMIDAGRNLGDGLAGHLQSLAELPQRLAAAGVQRVEQGPPAGVRECAEHLVHHTSDQATLRLPV